MLPKSWMDFRFLKDCSLRPQTTKQTATFEDETLAALDSVYRFALQLTKDRADADDLVQDTYLRAYRGRKKYQLGTNCTSPGMPTWYRSHQILEVLNNCTRKSASFTRATM